MLSSDSSCCPEHWDKCKTITVISVQREHLMIRWDNLSKVFLITYDDLSFEPLTRQLR